MREELRTISSTKKDIKDFSRVVGGVLVVLGLVSYFSGGERFAYYFVLGGLLLLLGAVSPNLLRPLQKAWMALAILLGWIMTRLILIFLFFGIITSLGFLMRLFGKQLLNGEWDPSLKTYWVGRKTRQMAKETYNLQF